MINFSIQVELKEIVLAAVGPDQAISEAIRLIKADFEGNVSSVTLLLHDHIPELTAPER